MRARAHDRSFFSGFLGWIVLFLGLGLGCFAYATRPQFPPPGQPITCCARTTTR